jgi:amino-acid N-acetyltransferase
LYQLLNFHEMQSTVSIQKAAAADFDAVCALLSANNLPTADLNPLLDNFLVALEEGKVVAVMGIDRYGASGLLRSAVVSASHRNTGLAAALLQQLLEAANQSGLANLYLITNTAENYFGKKGFAKNPPGRSAGGCDAVERI